MVYEGCMLQALASCTQVCLHAPPLLRMRRSYDRRPQLWPQLKDRTKPLVPGVLKSYVWCFSCCCHAMIGKVDFPMLPVDWMLAVCAH